MFFMVVFPDEVFGSGCLRWDVKGLLPPLRGRVVVGLPEIVAMYALIDALVIDEKRITAGRGKTSERYRHIAETASQRDLSALGASSTAIRKGYGFNTAPRRDSDFKALPTASRWTNRQVSASPARAF